MNPKDQWHDEALLARTRLGNVTVVTTEMVLVELLNYFSENGSEARRSVIEAVRTIMADDEIEFLPHFRRF